MINSANGGGGGGGARFPYVTVTENFKGFIHTQYGRLLFKFFPYKMCQKYVAAKCQILQHSAVN